MQVGGDRRLRRLDHRPGVVARDQASEFGLGFSPRAAHGDELGRPFASGGIAPGVELEAPGVRAALGEVSPHDELFVASASIITENAAAMRGSRVVAFGFSSI